MTADLVPFDFTVHIWLDNFRGTKPFKMRSYSKLEMYLFHHSDMNTFTAFYQKMNTHSYTLRSSSSMNAVNVKIVTFISTSFMF